MKAACLTGGSPHLRHGEKRARRLYESDARCRYGCRAVAVCSAFTIFTRFAWVAGSRGTCLGLHSVEVPATSLRNDCKTNRCAGKQPFQAFIALVCFLRQNQVYFIHAQACVASDLAA